MIHTARNNLDQFSARSESPRTMLESSLGEAHMLIKASRFINEKDPHSTAVMLLLQPGPVELGALRRQPPLPLSWRSAFFLRTTDHSYVEQLVAKGKITPEQALVHPNRNILMTSLGGDEEPKIDFGESDDLQAGDSFLLCSDGPLGLFRRCRTGRRAGRLFGTRSLRTSDQPGARARARRWRQCLGGDPETR